MMSYYGYNFPWSGRLGRIAKCCPWCGRNDSSWTLSSSGHCLNSDCSEKRFAGAKQDPVLKIENDNEYERLARAWCLKNNIDYDKTVASLLKNMGPQMQERSTPIPGDVEDYIVYLDQSGHKYVDNYKVEIRSLRENTRKILSRKYTVILPLRFLAKVHLDKLYATLILGWTCDFYAKDSGYYFWTGSGSYIIKDSDYKDANPKPDYRTTPIP